MDIKKNIQVILALLFYILIFSFIISSVSNILNFNLLIERREFLLKGFYNTIFLSILSLLTSVLIGFLLFLMGLSKITFVKMISYIFIEIIMGTPILVFVFVMFYIVGAALSINDKLLIGFMTMTLYVSPYMSNMYMSAYKSISESQFVIMDLYDFKFYDRYRYLILPQMIKPIIPLLINNLSIIVKTTSILSTIGIVEIFYAISVVSNETFRYIEGYLLLWLAYLIITIPLSLLAKYLTKRYMYEY